MPKIVVAEDDKLLSGSLVSAFTEAQFEVFAAYDGEEAIAKIKEVKPDAVLLDVMMPKLDGIGVLWELKANPETSGTPVVVLTNMADMDTIAKIMDAGGTDYLLKSDQSIDKIIEKVRQVMARSKASVQ
ncbi:MAG: response regulator [Candidatus Doudnabacteria bacterium]|nr:response regulator [Candidatus Doudnabacteria bacterium]